MFIFKQIINNYILRRVASISLLSILFLGLIYVLFSPSLIAASNQGMLFSLFSIPSAKAVSQTVQLTVANEATVSAPGTLTLSGTINGISGGVASGTAAFGVLSASNVGFTMSVHASQTNALVGTGTYNFSDYAPAVAGSPDFTWVSPIAGSSAFGFAVLADAVGSANQKWRYTTTAPCNVSGGTGNAVSNCWYGFNSTADIQVVNNTAGFHSTLSTETLNFEAEHKQGSGSNNVAIPEGTYTATITVTVAAS